jgi:dihydrofolate synthase/folylpolyglutamate synthase
VHIAGTNGKGSVTAMVHAALVASGVRAARYTSPHLSDLRERFVIGSEPVDRAALESAAADVLDCADRLRRDGVLPVHPTFFEAATAIGFELFRRAAVDVAVIETGLGGRFDATNVLAARIGAITSIGFDHQQYLGDTLEEIAFEKAGIIKRGMTVVTGGLPEGAARRIARVAAEQDARLVGAAEGIHVDAAMADGRAVLTVETPIACYGPVTLGLRGEHQIGNALVAVRLLDALRESGVSLRGGAVEHGLANPDWPARLELIQLPNGKRVLLDAAHNIDGARALARYLERWHPEKLPLVIGVMRDKDVSGILAALLPVTSAVVATAADTARAMPAQALAARIADARRDMASSSGNAVALRTESDPMVAVEDALARADTVCVAGSVFLAGEVRESLRTRAILR